MPRATPREIRSNLLVLAVVLVVVTPGAVILIKKKSQPGARPIGAADVVINTTAFMDPYAGPGMERLAPLAVVEWTQSLLPAGASPVTPTKNPTRLVRRKSSTVGSEIPLPDMDLVSAATVPTSENHYLQLVAQTGDEATVVLWSEVPLGGVKVNGVVAAPSRQATHAVPTDLRHVMQNAGFVDPPPAVTVFTVAAKPGDSVEAAFGKVQDDLRLPAGLPGRLP